VLSPRNECLIAAALAGSEPIVTAASAYSLALPMV
jgi:hypothetical protein